MSVDAVLDTNIFLYALSKAPEEAAKSQTAQSLIASVCFGVPMQVIQEFYHNAHAKARLGISPENCSRMVAALIQRPIVLTDLDIFNEAKNLTLRYPLSYWDAAIIAATHRLKASLLYSEDLSHGQTYGKVKVINPFAEL